MKFLRGLLSRKDDQLRRKAERLVSSARVNATSLFAPTIDQHALLRNVKTERWDFVVTIAGVFIATTRLWNLKIGDQREQELTDIIMRGLAHWDPNNGIPGIEDCKATFEILMRSPVLSMSRASSLPILLDGGLSVTCLCERPWDRKKNGS
jgi:hypothetical protein